MTFHTLAAFLLSWVVPEEPAGDENPLPRWERHPAEQAYLRDQDRRTADLWSHIPRSW